MSDIIRTSIQVSVQDNGLLAVAGHMGHELGLNDKEDSVDDEAGEGEGK